jgi:glyoxylase-like metal-dependent hydrolase (beta-lactamase superfamily II)
MAYYKTHSLGGGVYLLFEPLGVGAYLILGREKALLIDTGFGFGDLPAAVGAVTSMPLLVVNSHVHPDHALGNRQFPRGGVGAGDRGTLAEGVWDGEYRDMLGFAKKYLPPLGFLMRRFGKLPKPPLCQTAYSPLAEGDTLNLGGRVLEVAEMPGHTRGSLVFLDRATATVFAGDAVNRGTFLYLDREVKLAGYANRLDALAARKGFGLLRGSHAKKAAPFSFVAYYADFLRRAGGPGCKTVPMPLAAGPVLRYREKSTAYGSVSVFFLPGQEAEHG